MFAVITPEKIQLPPGTIVRLSGSWQDYQKLTQQLGDRSIPRIKYHTDVNDYLPYRVPEVWLYKRNQLRIYNLESDRYNIVTNSRYFPDVNISEILTECFRIAKERNVSAAIRELRQKLESEK